MEEVITVNGSIPEHSRCVDLAWFVFVPMVAQQAIVQASQVAGRCRGDKYDLTIFSPRCEREFYFSYFVGLVFHQRVNKSKRKKRFCLCFGHVNQTSARTW